MTHWSLRSVTNWAANIYFEKKKRYKLNSNLDKLKEKFGLALEKIETIPKNRYGIKCIFIISFFFILYITFYYNNITIFL